jgi:hypothetical protein
MRKAPEWFLNQLKQEHDGRLRIRWSPARFRWQIEQKVDISKLAPFHIDSLDDDAIRAVDGYARVCEISPGTLTPCTNTGLDGRMCGHDLRAPFGQFVQVRCPRCRADGFHGGQILSHFELDDNLLQHLRRIDPNRGAYEATRDKLRVHNRTLMDSRIEAAKREMRAVAFDDAKVCITKRGYSGKDTMWADAPAPKYQGAA